MSAYSDSDRRLLAKTVFARPKVGGSGSPTEKAMAQAEVKRRFGGKK